MPLIDNPLNGLAAQASLDEFDLSDNRQRINGVRNSNFTFFRRPFLHQIGQREVPCVLANTGQFTTEKGQRVPIRRIKPIMQLLNEGRRDVPVWTLNATTLRKEDWIEIDRRVLTAQRYPLVLAADMSASSTYGGFNAYGRATLEYEAMSDPGQAVQDMYGDTDILGDAPQFTLRSMPLPLTRCGFSYSDRFLEISRNSGTPMDAASAEAASARVAEYDEDVAIGNLTGLTYGTQATGATAHEGNSTVWGMINFTYRSTKTNLTVPTGSNPNATLADVLAMMQTARENKYQGPYNLYFTLAFAQFLDNDYAFTNGSNWAVNPSQTLRQRLEAIEGITSVKVLPRWNETVNTALTSNLKYACSLVQMTENVVQYVAGQPVNTIMWETKGGRSHNFEVWGINAPRFRAEYNQKTGIVHATTS